MKTAPDPIVSKRGFITTATAAVHDSISIKPSLKGEKSSCEFTDGCSLRQSDTTRNKHRQPLYQIMASTTPEDAFFPSARCY